ncbi:hypothetical protein [Collinsella sp. An268]|uniref:hypothetical protein n=1 Tax=Collinsella sp. An268 TaxID=1965612 RepID=UPI000B38F8F5|nr:hypothetical protein [Collinsella sp. An268]OUO65019.1 hypothetical protein B5F70_02905 [Collinsella sp. An268]
MVIIIAESALAYWRTPPAIRDLELAPEMLGPEMMPPRDIQRRLRCARRNDGAVIRALRERILTDLKGIPLPITVVTDETQRRGTDPIVTITKSCPDSIGPFAVDLGNGLFVSSPALALAHLAQRVSAAHTMHLMYEMCGLYTLFCPTERARCAERLVATGTPMTPAAYCDATGARIPYEEDARDSLWGPCTDRRKAENSLWKRPPLISSEALAAELMQIPAVRGITKARALAPFVLDGSGSPLETTMCLLEFLPAELGGEGWEIPDLNRVVPLTERGRTVLEGDHLVADQLWADRNCLLEINGQEYHEGREAFARTSARRAALEAMGYIVREINYDQAADLDKLDTILTSWAEALSLRHQPRARAFVQRRAQLHAALFSIPGIHGNPAIRRSGW